MTLRSLILALLIPIVAVYAMAERPRETQAALQTVSPRVVPAR